MYKNKSIQEMHIAFLEVTQHFNKMQESDHLSLIFNKITDTEQLALYYMYIMHQGINVQNFEQSYVPFRTRYEHGARAAALHLRRAFE